VYVYERLPDMVRMEGCMTFGVLAVLGIAVMVIALFLTPIGIPGNWIMVGVLAAGALLGEVGVGVLIATLLIAGFAEIVEFMIVKRLNLRYGGSSNAFWGSIGGGIVGVMVGLPVPIVGSIIAGFVGSFAGAAIVTYLETTKTDAAMRVGWGVLLGRGLSAAAKSAAGVVILVLGAAALLVR
jgi:uncharacterized protein YqgC (DUF456 family)